MPSRATAVPIAFLTQSAETSPDPTLRFPLLARNYVLGRDSRCDIVLPTANGVSRQHAYIDWKGDHFEISSEAGRETTLNGVAIPIDRPSRLNDGDHVGFGPVELVFLDAAPGLPDPATTPSYQALSRQFSSGLKMMAATATLDPAAIVAKGLELVRLVTGVERSMLIGTGVDPHIEGLLTPRPAIGADISQSAVEEAIQAGRPVARFISDDTGEEPTESMRDLNLRRVWAAPIEGVRQAAVAVLYLDSPLTGVPLSPEVEDRLISVVRHISVALQNASLYAQVVALNDTLEQKVEERTRALEHSQAQLVAQDRLATLGKLVAAIAHELNNPAGAIVSFASTLRTLIEPVRTMDLELEHRFEDPDRRRSARLFLDQALAASTMPALDSRRRRQREQELAAWLSGQSVQAADALARRLARIGFDQSAIEPMIELLRLDGEWLSSMAESIHTFGRSLETIGQCGGTIARIVDGLKTYAHLDRSEAEVADIHTSLQATLSVLAPRIPPGIEVVTDFDDIRPFRHRPGELTQVWTNLVDNALRAMGESGTLTIVTRSEGDAVVITITDTGTGIEDAVASRIFELHYTTRGPGAGLGLGLPICRSIVEEHHGGALSFETRRGETTFSVRLPIGPD